MCDVCMFVACMSFPLLVRFQKKASLSSVFALLLSNANPFLKKVFPWRTQEWHLHFWESISEDIAQDQGDWPLQNHYYDVERAFCLGISTEELQADAK